MSVEGRLAHEDTVSEESSNEKSDERGASPPAPVLSHDIVKNSSDDYSHLSPMPSNGILDTTPPHKADQSYHQSDTMATEPSDDISLAEEKVVFCDCPPDPELPQGFNLHNIM